MNYPFRKSTLPAPLFLSILLLISACAIAPAEMRRRCAEEGGEKIVRTASNVRGVYYLEFAQDPARTGGIPKPMSLRRRPHVCNHVCIDLLIGENFSFVEMYADQKASPTYGNLMPGNVGHVRWELKDRGHPDCEEFEIYLENRVGGQGQSREQVKQILENGKCIANSSIETPTSRYMLFSYGDIPDIHPSYDYRTSVVYDRVANETIASYTSFSCCFNFWAEAQNICPKNTTRIETPIAGIFPRALTP